MCVWDPFYCITEADATPADINNVGAISQALYANDPDYDEVKAAQWQATQVSTISIANCLGRILIGNFQSFSALFSSDYAHRPDRGPREAPATAAPCALPTARVRSLSMLAARCAYDLLCL